MKALRFFIKCLSIAVEAFLGIFIGLLLKRITGEHFETATWIPQSNLLTERVEVIDNEIGFDTIAEVDGISDSGHMHILQETPTPII